MHDAHDLKVSMSPMITHDLKSECMSPMIMKGDQTTYQTIGNAHNNSITWGYHDLAMISARYRQDPSNCQDNGHDPLTWDIYVHFFTGGTYTLSPTCQNKNIG